MAKEGVKIELDGPEFKALMNAFQGLPKDVEASVIRAVARKPANKIVSIARKLFTRKKSGASKRSIGILRVKDRSQKFLEIGVKGKSWAYIWMFFKGIPRQKKSGASTGEIKPLGNVVQKAAEQSNAILKEFTVDLNKVIVKSLKKYLKR